MSDTHLALQRYRFGDSAFPDVAPQLRTLTYAQDVDGRDDMQFSVISPVEDAKRLFAPGDYAVLRDAVGYTLSWGRVLTRSTRIQRSPSGELTMQPYPITVAGWFDFMMRAQIHILTGGTTGPVAGRIGNVWPYPKWAAMTAGLMASFGGGTGEQLQYLLENIGNVQVPESLNGGKLGNLGTLIPVVYDNATALKYAPRFKDIEPVDNGHLAPDRLVASAGVTKTTVGGLIRSTFVPDPSIIELFPAMVDGGSEPYNSLASVLGRRPVLVYRVKPWRDEPLWKNTVAKAAYTYEDFEATVLSGSLKGKLDDNTERKAASARRIAAKQRNRKLLISDKIFTKVTMDSGDVQVMVPIHDKYVRSIQGTVDDASRVNAVTINVTPLAGGDVSETLGDSALPILIDDQIEKHGLRMKQASWPMIAADGSADAAFYRTAAAQTMQFNMMNHVLETGTMKMHYTAAMVVRENTTAQQTQFERALDLNPGQWFRTKIGDLSEYVGYIHAMQHAMSFADDGRRAAETTVQFVRGHHVEATELITKAIVPIGDVPLPTQVNVIPLDTSQMSVPSGQQARDRLTKARYTQSTAQPLVSDVGKYFYYQGNKIPTSFDVIHMPVDVSGTIANPLYQHHRTSPITKCVVHTYCGSRGSNAQSIYNFFTKNVRFGAGVSAHVMISPSGAVVQYFDLAVTCFHAASFNEASISIELNVPTPEKNPLKFIAHAYNGPWPSAENWRWWYTKSADASTAYSFGRRVHGQYGPTGAQKATFVAVAKAYNEHFNIPLTGIPRDKNAPNTAVRSVVPSVIEAQWANPAWGFYHHAQLTNNRSDATGIDIPLLLGQPLGTISRGP